MTLALPSLLPVENPSALAPLVRVTRLTVEALHDPRLTEDASLVARIRGAFGHKLAAMAESGGEARDAWRMLFSEKSSPSVRGNAPAPFVIAADVLPGGNLVATLSLFGIADRWRQAAFDAFVAALCERPGLRLSSSLRVGSASAPMSPLRAVSVRWTREEGVVVPPRCNRLRLSFATPVQFGPDGYFSDRYDDIIVGLAERVSLLAPLFGCSFKVRLGAWRDIARNSFYDADALKPVRFSLWSSGGGMKKRYGWRGDLIVADPLAEMCALLAIGEQVHCGREAAKGFGRYRLFPEP